MCDFLYGFEYYCQASFYKEKSSASILLIHIHGDSVQIWQLNALER